MMARLFLKNPSVVILDEALAAVDSNSEAFIQQALARLLEGRTAIIIAHRLSSLMMADHVVVLENGTIVEEGRHEELLSLGRSYATLFSHQCDVKNKMAEPRTQLANQTA
jgi:ABC-type multidrug transport system fused ATPase/permease subunit